MTFSQIVLAVCSEMGQVDSNSQKLVQGFVERRYQTIYNSEFWLDVQDDAQGITVGGQSYIEYPPNLERIQSIRLNGKMLEPTTRQTMMETDPSIFERTGEPLYWLDYYEKTTRTNRVRFFPTPDAAYSLLIVGRTEFPGITDLQDKPIIRNIDNALIAFSLGDLCRRQRVWAKAEKAYEEAAAQLDLLRKIEQEQSNVLRRSKTVTVTGDSLAELTDAVCTMCGGWTRDSVIFVKERLRRRYQEVYDAALWPESLVLVNLNRQDAEVILPEYFDEVQAIRANTQFFGLTPVDQVLYFDTYPTMFEQTGTPVSFERLTPVAVAVLPEQNERLVLVSSSATDKSKVFIKGESGGVEVSETLILNGTSPVSTQFTYDTPLTIAKEITTGDVTISGALSTTFFQRIPAAETERKHVRLWLQPTPSASEAKACLCLGKRRIRPLLTDQDTPLLRGIANVLIMAAAADLFARLGNEKAALAAKTDWQSSLGALLDKQTNQSAIAHRVIPYVDQPWGADYLGVGGFGGDQWWSDKGNFIGGGETMANGENDSVPLTIGQLTVSDSFKTTKGQPWFFTHLYVQNTTDATPLEIRAVPTATNSNGFTVSLTAAPDTNNYTLFWGAAMA